MGVPVVMDRWLFALILLLGTPAFAFWHSVQQTAVVTTSSYVGPGDVVSGAAVFYGLRGYNTAYATPGTGKSVNVRRASDDATQDIVILPNGNFDAASAASFAGTDATATCSASASTSLVCTAASSTPQSGDPISGTGVSGFPAYIVSCGTFTAGAGTCTMNASRTIVSETVTFQVALFVTEWYDQSGNGIHATQGTSGSQPQLFPGACAWTGPPGCVYYNGSSSLLGFTPGTISQPFTMYGSVSVADGSSFQQIIAQAGVEVDLFITSNTMGISAGSGLFGSVISNSVPILAIGAFSGASSVVYKNLTATSGNSGTTGITTPSDVGGPSHYNGFMVEAAIWPSLLSSGNVSSICSNINLEWSNAC